MDKPTAKDAAKGATHIRLPRVLLSLARRTAVFRCGVFFGCVFPCGRFPPSSCVGESVCKRKNKLLLFGMRTGARVVQATERDGTERERKSTAERDSIAYEKGLPSDFRPFFGQTRA